MENDNHWDRSHRIEEHLIEVLNQEVAIGTSPHHLLAATCATLLAIIESMDDIPGTPSQITILQAALTNCLDALFILTPKLAQLEKIRDAKLSKSNPHIH